MSVDLGHLESLVDLPTGGSSSLVGGEDGTLECRRFRVGTGFTFPLITLENPIVVSDFEGDALYRKIWASLTSHLRRPPSHTEVVWWLEECSRARTHGFPYLFRRGGATRMGKDGRSSRSEFYYS